MTYPPLHIFNEDDEPIGEAMLEEILEKGLLHRVIHVIVEDENRNVLLQMRGLNVKTDPGTWDYAVGGYVDAGENYIQAAKRELQEELGVAGVQLQDLGVSREKLNIDGYDVNRFSGEFKAVIPSATKLIIDESEVGWVEWFNMDKLRQLVNSNSKDITPYFKRRLKEYYFSDENHVD